MKVRSALLAFFAAVSLSACGVGTTLNVPGLYGQLNGGGSGSNLVPTTQPPNAPPATATQPVNNAAPSTVAVAPFNGIAATATLPAPTNQTSAAVITTTSGANPTAAGAPNIPLLTSTTSTPVSNVLSYTAASSNTLINYPGGSTLTVAIPPTVNKSGTGYWLAINAPGAGWIYDVAQGTANGGNVTFTIPQGITLKPGENYLIALYQH